MQTISFWIIQGPGWALLAYLVYAQCIPAVNYKLGVRMGTQEPATQITEVGVAFWWGLAVADLVFYVPLLGAGLIGHWIAAPWGKLLLAGALAITVYWPVTSLATVHRARGAEGWQLPKERDYWIVLPVITLWALWSLWSLVASVQ